jgi:hypothetical protein
LTRTHKIRSGCSLCIHFRLACNSLTFLSDRYKSSYGFLEYDMKRRSNILKGSNPPLPAELQAWVDSWIERRKSWQQKESTCSHRGLRKAECGRRDYSRSVVIDGYTLDGVYLKYLGHYGTLTPHCRSWCRFQGTRILGVLTS